MADVCSWRTQKKTKSDCVYPFSKIVCDHIKFTHKPETPNNSEGQSKQQARQKPPVTSNIWIYIYIVVWLCLICPNLHTHLCISYIDRYIYYIIHNYTHTHIISAKRPTQPRPSRPSRRPGVHPRRLSDLRRDRYQGDGLHELRGFEWDGEKKTTGELETRSTLNYPLVMSK